MVESRSAQPLVDMRMMRIPVVWTTNLVALLFGVGMYATFAFLPEFLQTPASAGYGFGLSITFSGLILLPSSVAMFAGRHRLRTAHQPVRRQDCPGRRGAHQHPARSSC